MLINTVWKTIEKKYSERNRYYHNLSHIKSMLRLAKENETAMHNFDEVLSIICKFFTEGQRSAVLQKSAYRLYKLP